MPFDFILPYEENIFKLKKKNINYFKVTFSQNSQTLVKKQLKLEQNAKGNTENNNFATNLKLNNVTNKTPTMKFIQYSHLSKIRNIDNNVNARLNNNISTNSNNNLPISLSKIESSFLQGQNTINNKSNYKMPYVNKIIKLSTKPKSSSNLIPSCFLSTPSKTTSGSINNNYNNIVVYNNSNFNTPYNKINNRIFQLNNFNNLNPTQFTNISKPINNNINKHPFINTKKINYYQNNNASGKKSFDFNMGKRYVVLNHNNLKGPQTISSSYIYK